MPAAFHICKSILVPIAGGTFRTARALTCHWPRLRARPRQPLAPILSSTQWQPTAMGLVQCRRSKAPAENSTAQASSPPLTLPPLPPLLQRAMSRRCMSMVMRSSIWMAAFTS